MIQQNTRQELSYEEQNHVTTGIIDQFLLLSIRLLSLPAFAGFALVTFVIDTLVLSNR